MNHRCVESEFKLKEDAEANSTIRGDCLMEGRF